MQRTNLVTRSLGVALALAFSAGAMAGPVAGRGGEPFVENMFPPLVNWQVDQEAGIAEVHSRIYANAKAAQDKATVYRPVPVCRLVDTRGFPAAVAIAGPLAANSTTNVNTGNACGIPTSGVAGISASVSVQNQTPNNGGFITLLQQGDPVTGVNAVLNFNTIWSAVTANISIPNSSGDFSIFVATSTIHVVIDINGYYQDLNTLNVGTQEFDLNGSGPGSTFQFSNSGTNGTALTAGASASGGTGFRLTNGRFAVTGAAELNGNNAVFVHRVDSSAFFGSGTGTLCDLASFNNYTIIDHPMINGDPNAVLFIQPRDAVTGLVAPDPESAHAYYFNTQSGCDSASAAGKWAIRSLDESGLTTDMRFNVMIIKP